MIKVGSIVAVKNGWDIHPDNIPFVKWRPVCDEKTPYTVRACDGKCALLEEGIIGIHPLLNCEYGVNLEYLIELLPPENVEIEEIIKDVLLQPQD